jgi:hypothetical protein
MSHEEHYWSMEQLQEHLTATKRADATYVERVIRGFVHRAMVVALLAARSDVTSGAPVGAFHLFAFDFVVGADLQPRMLEANAKPAMCSRNSATARPKCRDVPCAGWLLKSTRTMEADKIALVRELHEGSTGLDGLGEGEHWHHPGGPMPGRRTGFRLIYSEQQRRCETKRPAPNPCTMFGRNGTSL